MKYLKTKPFQILKLKCMLKLKNSNENLNWAAPQMSTKRLIENENLC